MVQPSQQDMFQAHPQAVGSFRRVVGAPGHEQVTATEEVGAVGDDGVAVSSKHGLQTHHVDRRPPSSCRIALWVRLGVTLEPAESRGSYALGTLDAEG